MTKEEAKAFFDHHRRAAAAAIAARAVCSNCGGPHATAKCPIPPDYDGNYRRDSKGSSGCGCKE